MAIAPIAPVMFTLAFAKNWKNRSNNKVREVLKRRFLMLKGMTDTTGRLKVKKQQSFHVFDELCSTATPFGEICYYWSFLNELPLAVLDPLHSKESPCKLTSPQELHIRLGGLVFPRQPVLSEAAVDRQVRKHRRMDFRPDAVDFAEQHSVYKPDQFIK